MKINQAPMFLKCKGGVLLALGLWLVPAVVPAASAVEFPNEELASESVLPVFDPPDSVKNRNVTTQKRFEFGVMGGYAMTEPFFNPMSIGASGSYHFTEEHGVNLFGLSYLGGQSDYSKQLNPIPGQLVNANLQFAPAPKYLFMASYQHTGFYGKLSLAKNIVMNLSLYGLAGIGMIGIGDVSKPVVSVGLGQKFYFNSMFALRFDLRLLAYQGPDPLSRRLVDQTEVQPASFFDERTFYESLLSFGAVFMLPEM